jgi:hypothetical protein
VAVQTAPPCLPPISFILRAGEIHDWALLPFLDGAQVQQQIYQEFGLTDASTSAATANPDIVDALHGSEFAHGPVASSRPHA